MNHGHLNLNDWFVEQSFHKNSLSGFKVKKVLFEGTSQFQEIKVVDTESVGKLLLLNGKTMVSELDEFIYHEIMAHIPYASLHTCQSVLIIGGGDGGVVREFCRHQSIKKIDLVEIDEQVIEVSKEFFPSCGRSVEDPRVAVHAVDGIEFIKSKKNEYDVIIVDSTDPEDFAAGLFTRDFYNNVSEALTENGVMMNQTECPFFDEYDIGKIYTNMRNSFPSVHSLAAPMLIYPGVYWTFGYCSKQSNASPLPLEEKVLELKKIEDELQWYNTEWHRGAFSLGTYHKRKIGL